MTDPKAKTPVNAREARLAAALRTNLARRKSLSRSLGSEDIAAEQAEIPPAPAADSA
jgi:hypothetical protein